MSVSLSAAPAVGGAGRPCGLWSRSSSSGGGSGGGRGQLQQVPQRQKLPPCWRSVSGRLLFARYRAGELDIASARAALDLEVQHHAAAAACSLLAGFWARSGCGESASRRSCRAARRAASKRRLPRRRSRSRSCSCSRPVGFRSRQPTVGRGWSSSSRLRLAASSRGGRRGGGGGMCRLSRHDGSRAVGRASKAPRRPRGRQRAVCVAAVCYRPPFATAARSVRAGVRGGRAAARGDAAARHAAAGGGERARALWRRCPRAAW